MIIVSDQRFYALNILYLVSEILFQPVLMSIDIMQQGMNNAYGVLSL